MCKPRDLSALIFIPFLGLEIDKELAPSCNRVLESSYIDMKNNCSYAKIVYADNNGQFLSRGLLRYRPVMNGNRLIYQFESDNGSVIYLAAEDNLPGCAFSAVEIFNRHIRPAPEYLRAEKYLQNDTYVFLVRPAFPNNDQPAKNMWLAQSNLKPLFAEYSNKAGTIVKSLEYNYLPQSKFPFRIVALDYLNDIRLLITFA